MIIAYQFHGFWLGVLTGATVVLVLLSAAYFCEKQGGTAFVDEKDVPPRRR